MPPIFIICGVICGVNIFALYNISFSTFPLLCKDLHNKGNVENKVGYERRNMFVPVKTILDFNTFNQSLFDACEKDAKREHYIKKMPIETLFQEDIQEMLPLNEIPYEIYILEPRKTDNYAKVTFDNIKTFEGYDFNKIIIPNTTSMDGIKSLDFVERNENLILYGRNGAGKSHMATAIGVEACMQGKKVRFYKTATLVNELTDAKSEGSLTKLLKKLSKLDLLICDEWG